MAQRSTNIAQCKGSVDAARGSSSSRAHAMGKARANAHQRLAEEVIDARARGEVVPCLQSWRRDLFVSEQAKEQEQARAMCLACPRAVFEACAVAGSRERAGTWAGKTRRSREEASGESAPAPVPAEAA